MSETPNTAAQTITQPESLTTSLTPGPRVLPFRHALATNGDSSSWNLSADVVGYPFIVPGGNGKKYRIGVYLNRYEARELKEAMSHDRLGYKPDMDGGLAIINRTFREYFPMLERRFVAIDGLSGNEVEQREFFLHNTALKTLVVRDGWGGVRIWREDDEDSVEDTPFDI